MGERFLQGVWVKLLVVKEGEAEVLQAFMKLAYNFRGCPTQIPTVYPTTMGAGNGSPVNVRELV